MMRTKECSRNCEGIVAAVPQLELFGKGFGGLLVSGGWQCLALRLVGLADVEQNREG